VAAFLRQLKRWLATASFSWFDCGGEWSSSKGAKDGDIQAACGVTKGHKGSKAVLPYKANTS
jgi:hypothetical protein